MVDMGREIWLINLRGVDYSKEHVRDGDDDWTLREKWDFSWADSGYYDVPAVLDFIIKETGYPKIPIVAHSQGTSSMWYGLSKRQDFYAERVTRFIAMAACIFPESYNYVPTDYEGITNLFLKAD